MVHARDEHGFSNFEDFYFKMLLEDKYGALAYRKGKDIDYTLADRSTHPNYKRFLHEQVIIQEILAREDEWKAHTGNWYSEDRRIKALKKNKKLSKLANGQVVLESFFQKKLIKDICKTFKDSYLNICVIP